MANRVVVLPPRRVGRRRFGSTEQQCTDHDLRVLVQTSSPPPY